VASKTEQVASSEATETTPAEAEVTEAKPKAKKVTARDQGVPEVYLSEAGTFRPGYDAKMKSDLITAVLGSPTLHTFTAEEAEAILESRGWTKFLVLSREARERKSA